MEIDGILDLHHFRPREVPDLVREYLRECKRHHIGEVRIIHGKGKGVLRAIVQDILAHDKDVVDFGPPHDGSGWGVTIARLRIPGGHQSASHAEKQSKKPDTQETPTGWWWWIKVLLKPTRR